MSDNSLYSIFNENQDRLIHKWTNSLYMNFYSKEEVNVKNVYLIWTRLIDMIIWNSTPLKDDYITVESLSSNKIFRMGKGENVGF